MLTNRIEAERVVDLLDFSGVSAYVGHGALGVALEMRFSVYADASLARRARWLIARTPGATDTELDCLATDKPLRAAPPLHFGVRA